MTPFRLADFEIEVDVVGIVLAIVTCFDALVVDFCVDGVFSSSTLLLPEVMLILEELWDGFAKEKSFCFGKISESFWCDERSRILDSLVGSLSMSPKLGRGEL